VAYQIHEIRLRCIQEALQRSHVYARLASDRFEDIIAEARSVLEMVSKVSDVTSGTETTCQEFLGSVGHTRRWISAIWVIGNNGRVRCSTVANATGLELSDREAYRAAVVANDFSIHDFYVGKLTKLPLAVASLPARDQSRGEPVLLAAALDLSWFDKLAADVGVRAGADILLVDSKGGLLSLFPKETAVAGDNVSRDETIRDILNGSEGQLEGTLVDGKPGFIGYVTLSGTSLRLIVGFERSQILADANRRTIQAISIFGPVLLFAAGLIWFASNRIFTTKRELDELLRVTLDNLDQGLIVDDKHGTIPICNRRAIELLGLPEELMKSRPRVEAVIEFQKRWGELAGSRRDIKDRLLSGGIDEKNIYEQ
jgi:PAS domain-containing protein